MRAPDVENVGLCCLLSVGKKARRQEISRILKVAAELAAAAFFGRLNSAVSPSR